MGAFGRPILGGPGRALRVILSALVAYFAVGFSFPRDTPTNRTWIFWPDLYCIFVAADELPRESKADVSCGDLYARSPSYRPDEKLHFVAIASVKILRPGPYDLAALKLSATPRFIEGKFGGYAGSVLAIGAVVFGLRSVMRANRSQR